MLQKGSSLSALACMSVGVNLFASVVATQPSAECCRSRPRDSCSKRTLCRTALRLFDGRPEGYE